MALSDDLKNFSNSTEKLSEAAIRLESLFRDVAKGISDTAKSSEDLASIFNIAAKDVNNLTKAAAKARSYSKEDLKDKAKAKNLAKDINQLKRDQQTAEQTLLYLSKLRINATQEEADELDKVIEKLRDAIQGADELNEKLKPDDEVNNSIAKFEKKVGGVTDILKSIPGIGPALAGPLTGALASARKETIDFVSKLEESNIEASKFQITMQYAASFGSSLAKSFGPAAIVGGIFAADKGTTDLAKNLGVSKDTALEINNEFRDYSVSLGDGYINADKLRKALSELNSALGTAVQFSAEELEFQSRLTGQLGLSGDEAANIYKYQLLQNKSQKEITTEILDQVIALEAQTGIQLDGREIVKEVAKVNGQLGAQYGFNNKLLAQAVIQVKQFGLNLEQAQKIAQGLTDFEKSISAELEAELLTGKDINLERARLLALNGKTAEAAAEVAAQFGSIEEFQNMNIISQQAFADSIGITTDELANSIREREVLNALGAQSIEAALAEGKTREEIIAAGGEGLLQQYEQVSAAERFENAVIKIQEAIANMLEGPLGGLLEALGEAANSSGFIYSTMVALGALSLGRLLMGLASMAGSLGISAASAIATASAVTLGIGIAAIIAGIVAAMAATESEGKKLQQKGDDVISPAGYGDRVLKMGKDEIALNNDDTVIAGTNLGGGNSAQMNKVISLLEQILRKEGVVNMDGQKVGQLLAQGNYSLQ